MNIVFIGTSSGRTSLSRFHSSLLFENPNFGLLVDAGDGVSKALLNSGKKYDDINHILFTHHHADHFGGISALITQMKICGRTLPLEIFTNTGLKNSLVSYLNSCHMFLNDLGFDLKITEVEFDDKISLSEKFSFKLRRNTHLTEKTGQEDYKNVSFVSSSCLFRIDGKHIFYTSDVGSEMDLEIFNDHQIDLIISETTHLPLDSIIDFAQKSKIENIYLTHIDEPDESNIIDWAEAIRTDKNINIQAANDGMRINLQDVFSRY